jgi:hypothetical protein
MKPSMPPPAATWLLRRFGSGRGIEFLIGDLMEGYAHGRSVGWYWRQVLFAIVIGFFHEVRGHKLLAIRAIVTGWAVWLFLCGLLRNPPAVGDGVQSVLAQVLPANWWIHSFYPFALIFCHERLGSSKAPSPTSNGNGAGIRCLCAVMPFSVADNPGGRFAG